MNCQWMTLYDNYMGWYGMGLASWGRMLLEVRSQEEEEETQYVLDVSDEGSLLGLRSSAQIVWWVRGSRE